MEYIHVKNLEKYQDILFPEIKAYKQGNLEKFLLESICKPSDIDDIRFKENLNRQDLKIVILIDEMEESFEKLREIFGKGTKVPLRSTYEAVNCSTPPYMTIMAYGMISVMESLRFDEMGRLFSESIPEIPPRDFESENEYKNFWWWISRARWGWYNKYHAELDLSLSLEQFLYKINKIIVDNVSLFDFNNLHNRDDIQFDVDIHSILKKNFLEIFPHKIDLENETNSDIYSFNYDNLYFSRELVKIKEVIEKIRSDFDNIKERDENFLKLIEEIHDMSTLFLYLKYILEAISDKDSNLCLGYIKNDNINYTKHVYVANHFLIPLFQLIRDFIIEFQDDKQYRSTFDFLDYLIEILNNPHNIENISSLFDSIDTKPDPDYCQLSLKTVATLFPQPLYDPIINLNFKKKAEDLKLLDLLKDKSSDVLYIYKKPEIFGLDIFYFLIENKNEVSEYYSTDCLQAKSYEKDSIFIFLINTKTDREYKGIISEIRSTLNIRNLDYLIDINKFSFIDFKEERLSLFIKSIFYETQDLFEEESIENKYWSERKTFILNEIEESETLIQREKKKIKKSFNFFYDLLEIKLIDLIKDIVINFKKNLKENFVLGEEASLKNLMEQIPSFLGPSTAGRPVNILQILLLYSPNINKNFNLYEQIKDKWILLSDFLVFGTKQNIFNIFPNPNEIISDSTGYARFLDNALSTNRKITDPKKRKSVGLMNHLDAFLSNSNNLQKFKNFKQLCAKFKLEDSRVDVKEFNEKKLEKKLSKFIDKLDDPMDFTNMLSNNQGDGSEKKWGHIIELYYKIDSIPIKTLKKELKTALETFDTHVTKKFDGFLKYIKEINEEIMTDKVKSDYFYHHDGFINFKNSLDKFYKFFKDEMVSLGARQPFYYWSFLILKKVTPVIESYIKELTRRLDVFYKTAQLTDGFHGKKVILKDKLTKLKENYVKDLTSDNLDLTKIILNKLRISDLNKKCEELNINIDIFINNEIISKVFKDEHNDANKYLYWWVENVDLSIETLITKRQSQTPKTELENKIQDQENFYSSLNDVYIKSKSFITNFNDLSKTLDEINKILS